MVICLDAPSTSEPIAIGTAGWLISGLVGLSALVLAHSMLINWHDYTHCQDLGGGDAAVILASANSTATSTFAGCGVVPNTIMDTVEYSPDSVAGHSDVEIPGRPPGMKFTKTP